MPQFKRRKAKADKEVTLEGRVAQLENEMQLMTKYCQELYKLISRYEADLSELTALVRRVTKKLAKGTRSPTKSSPNKQRAKQHLALAAQRGLRVYQ